MDNIALELKDVTGKGFGFKLKNVSMTLENGYIYAVTGKNGAGKTTLFNYILTEKQRYTGSINLSGYELTGNHAKAMEITGLVSEDNTFFENRTGRQNAEILGLVYDNFDMELFDKCMKKMNVSSQTTLWRMSRGERMKFQLAFAIAHHSRLYLLDEATAGMDAVFKIELFDMLRQLIAGEDCCVLMTTHDMSEIAKNTDYVAIMDNGTLGEFVESIEV